MKTSRARQIGEQADLNPPRTRHIDTRPGSVREKDAQEQGTLSIVVPYTTPELTKAACIHVATFGHALKAQIRVIDVNVVPFPCPLNEPPVHKEHLERRLRTIVEESRVSASAELIYTRDRTQGFLRALQPGSVVVIATKRRWWPTPERNLARTLSQAGHQVALLETK